MTVATLSVLLVFALVAPPDQIEKPAVAESHCITFVVGQESDGEFRLSEPECFDSVEAADAWAAVGMHEAAEATGPSMRGQVSPLSTFTLGRHYDGFNGTGSSISIVGSSCTGGYWNTTSTWDNRISSSYNGCARLRHYDLPYKAGSAQNTYGAGTTDNLTTLNNKAESISYHSS